MASLIAGIEAERATIGGLRCGVGLKCGLGLGGFCGGSDLILGIAQIIGRPGGAGLGVVLARHPGKGGQGRVIVAGFVMRRPHIEVEQGRVRVVDQDLAVVRQRFLELPGVKQAVALCDRVADRVEPSEITERQTHACHQTERGPQTGGFFHVSGCVHLILLWQTGRAGSSSV